MLEKFIKWFIWKSDLCFSFFCYCASVIIKNAANFLRVCDCFVALWPKIDIWWSTLFPGHQMSDSFPSTFFYYLFFLKIPAKNYSQDCSYKPTISLFQTDFKIIYYSDYFSIKYIFSHLYNLIILVKKTI